VTTMTDDTSPPAPPSPPVEVRTRRITPQEMGRITLMQRAIQACPGPDAEWWPELAPLSRDERRHVCLLLAEAHKPPEP
jgi:hypothetical protein